MELGSISPRNFLWSISEKDGARLDLAEEFGLGQQMRRRSLTKYCQGCRFETIAKAMAAKSMDASKVDLKRRLK